jgi:hypothetical protein
LPRESRVWGGFFQAGIAALTGTMSARRALEAMLERWLEKAAVAASVATVIDEPN